MPTTAEQTRVQIRQAVGQIADAVNMDAGAITHSVSEVFSNAKFIDSDLPFGSGNEHRGKWVLLNDSASTTQVRRVLESDPDERSITLSIAVTGTLSTSWTYELWDQDRNPVTLNNYINQAIRETQRKGSITAEDLTFHVGGNVWSYAMDTSWTGVRSVQWRRSFTGEEIESYDDAPSSLSSNVTIISDSEDKREGEAAVRFTVAAGASSAEDLAGSSFAAVDARGYDQLEFWYKTNLTTSSQAFRVGVMQTSSAEEDVAVPGSSGGVWKYHVAALSNPEALSSVTALRFGTGSSDGGSATVWLDDVKFTRKGSERWATLPRDFWTIDQNSRELVINDKAKVPYAHLRIQGVRAPNQLASDSEICEVDDQYVVNSVMAKILRAGADVRGGRRDAAGLISGTYEQLAQIQRNRMAMPSNIVWMDD